MNDDMPWVNLTQEEIEQLRKQKQELTQYGKEKIRQLMNRSTENPDEIVLEDVKMFHLESMTENALWIGCYTQDGKIYHLNISAVGDKLRYYWSDETCD